ncbi:MAG: hypothetical protein R3345_14815, partial [Fulvivirga sp.]|nr:hypothetical protein [Fulvivirga sp.]
TIEVPLEIENIPEKAYIEKENIAVQYAISTLQENEVGQEQIKVIADFESMRAQDSTIVPQLIEYPKFITDVQIDTTRIKVYFNE